MGEEEICQNFADWLGRTWWGLTPSEMLMPLIEARYTVEEAGFLTGIPHSATSLEGLAELKGVDASNYEVRVEEETCKACGLCVKRCPMDALQLKFSPKAVNKFNKAAVVSNEACIGCGVCVHKCPTDSLKLVQRDVISDPPEDVRDYSMRFMADRKKGEPLLRDDR